MPTTTIGISLAAAVGALVINILLTPVILFISHKFNWYDAFDSRKVHTAEVPRLGGVGMFLSFVLSLLLLSLLHPEFSFFTFQIGVLLAGFLMIHLLGLIDDFRNIPAIWKLLGQILAGVMMVLGGALISGFEVPFLGIILPFGLLAAPLTVFWLISVSNAINLVDGIDGLAGGISLLLAIAVALVQALIGSRTGVIIAASLAGAIIGFLVYNRPRARIFMGDSGSLFLGFALGGLLFMDHPGEVTKLHMSFFLPGITLLLLPIMDMLASILRRIRQGRPIYSPDREHLHHKLLDFGFSVPQILGLVLSLAALSAAAVVFWTYVRFGTTGIPDWTADLAMIAIWALISGFFLIVHYANRNRKQRERTDTP
ncbi:glycosyltransferase family 4 protein [Spirochaeta africana]|uniref:UDP-N-acetylmuramyl pentapeptide phosphotransferase/UDP-N-acetylglucosamine-1-phosphate transferase n=1 Tax=Spirochaeta africana (strain ATCC 700263 / DSM 8902 / Z-7692) TaxID=889378 RepID=H9UF83_SPIAZ|nr:MraY family glycosyltransferase [Spirochaeta africana]AFG36176.1 UDP-N-acetylmuramyl pentapeptide phosphotransferase/UDP-N-acetylglucosamine-1-phosphate transferase [Spirochaeta africana DSM 8902]